MTEQGVRSGPGWGLLGGIAFTFFALGVTVNVLVLERVGSEARTIVAAIVVNSATSELAYLAVRDAGGSVVAAVIAGLVVASRFGLLAASLGSRLDVGRTQRVLAGLQAFDPNVGVAMQQASPREVKRAFWMVTAALHAGWWPGTLVGVFLGNVIGDAQRWGLDVVFPALLLAIIGNALRQRQGMVAAVVGGALCALLVPIAPAGVPIIVSVVGAVLAVRIRPAAVTP